MPLLVGAAGVALAVALVVLAQIGLTGHRGNTSAAAPFSATSTEQPPAVEVRRIHRALHDIGARCKPGVGGAARAQLSRDAALLAAFAQRHPNAVFPIDDETGRTVSLLLVARQSLRGCDQRAAARVDRALPSSFRDRS